MGNNNSTQAKQSENIPASDKIIPQADKTPGGKHPTTSCESNQQSKPQQDISSVQIQKYEDTFKKLLDLELMKISPHKREQFQILFGDITSPADRLEKLIIWNKVSNFYETASPKHLGGRPVKSGTNNPVRSTTTLSGLESAVEQLKQKAYK